MKIFKYKIVFKGLGRHTREEVSRIGMADIQALVDYLGDKRVGKCISISVACNKSYYYIILDIGKICNIFELNF